jgi:peptidyl-prolyl cis-trans isomerase D
MSSSADRASEEELVAYYADNQDNFQTRETVKLEYIELGADQFCKPIDKEAVLDAYQVEIDNGRYQTKHWVSHILFETGDDEALQQHIADAQAKLAAGEDFAGVAGEFSDNVGSVAVGGDLSFSSGDAFPPKMEEAILALEVDVVSGPVQTDAGTHLILVTDHREGKAPTLEELRPRLEDQLQSAQA